MKMFIYKNFLISQHIKIKISKFFLEYELDKFVTNVVHYYYIISNYFFNAWDLFVVIEFSLKIFFTVFL